MECDGVFTVYFERKEIFIHPFSDFFVNHKNCAIVNHNRGAPTVST